MRYGMLINLNYCVGCDACTIACKSSNGTPPGMLFSYVEHKEEGTYPNAILNHTPLLCMHCDTAACVAVCPTGASVKYADGTVGIDHELCIGCRSCVSACPYNMRSYLPENFEGYFAERGFTVQEEAMYSRYEGGKVYKCDFCASRRAEGLEPACVQACPAGARVFGDLDDPESEISKLIKEKSAVRYMSAAGTEPNVYYIPKKDFSGKIVQNIE